MKKAKAKLVFKTITLCDANNGLDMEGEPTYSMCMGHVKVSKFRTAFLNEGWDSAFFKKDELS